MRFYTIIALVLLSLSRLWSINDIELHLKIINLEEAQSPIFHFNQILFTVEPEADTRHVGISFAYEDYKRIHHFQRNERGLFFLLMDTPQREFLDYRIIVDGIWQYDPQAEEQWIDSSGIVISRVNIPRNHRPAFPTPQVMDEGWVEFSLDAENDQLIYLAGDFNHWDPYMIKMEEKTPGHYVSTLRLGQGIHHYSFFINGIQSLDPQNRNVQINPYGEEVSAVIVP
ncbi:MAG: hypothetical protein PF447_11125 [Spirochaetaceae bacterium]|nr:hypothetical protein [Spirochaetaceae bacterium]